MEKEMKIIKLKDGDCIKILSDDGKMKMLVRNDYGQLIATTFVKTFKNDKES